MNSLVRANLALNRAITEERKAIQKRYDIEQEVLKLQGGLGKKKGWLLGAPWRIEPHEGNVLLGYLKDFPKLKNYNPNDWPHHEVALLTKDITLLLRIGG